MGSDQAAVLEDAHSIGRGFHVEYALPGAVRHAIVIAADTDTAFMTDTPLDAQYRFKAASRQGLQLRLLFPEVLHDDAPSRAMAAHIGHRIEPVTKLPIHVINVLETACHEEVSTDIAIGTLDLALSLGPVRLAGTRQETVMGPASQQLGVVDDAFARVCFPQNRGLHAVVQNLAWHAAEMGKRFHVTAQDRWQVLV